MDLPVEQLSLGGHTRVSHEAAGPYDRNGGEEIGVVVILGWLHLPDRTEKGAPQIFDHMDFLTPFYGHDPASIRSRAATYRSCSSIGR
jgi:hypothetical protein